jgi:hypothetical protein
MTDTSSFDVRAQLARIDRDLAENEKLLSEARKLFAEERKLFAEERKLQRDTGLAPWIVAVNVFTVLLAAIVGGLIARVVL